VKKLKDKSTRVPSSNSRRQVFHRTVDVDDKSLMLHKPESPVLYDVEQSRNKHFASKT
jgi:hypothetical protein